MRKTRSQTQAEKANTAPGAVATNNAVANNVNPAQIKRYEVIINGLRVVELQDILSNLNVSIAGLKVDLQKRILNLLHTRFELVSSKIDEVYYQALADKPVSTQNNNNNPPRKAMYAANGSAANQKQMQKVDASSAIKAPCLVPGVENNGAMGMSGVNICGMNPNTQPNICGPNMGAHGMNGMPAANSMFFQPRNILNNFLMPTLPGMPPMPIHPDVRLKKLPFYDVLATLVKPSTLLPQSNTRMQEVAFYFTLTPQQASEIATNREISDMAHVEHTIQVQLRFCLLETSCEQDDCFPSSVVVKVNNKICQLPNFIPSNRPNVEAKRPPRPVNITSNVKLSPCITNTITVQWCHDFSRGYCIAVNLVQKLTSAQLLQRLKTRGVKPADYTRALIKEKLTEDADSEIATTMLKVSLNCPLGKMKMSLPCRASTCSHLQCFDANLYLQMNERKPTWKCPVCDRPATFDNLVIDGYFQEVLSSPVLKDDDTEIQLHKDGLWSTQNLRTSMHRVDDSPLKPPVQKVEVISDDVELVSSEEFKPSLKRSASAISSSTNTAKHGVAAAVPTGDTVDLTLSDSDDEDLPLAKRAAFTSSSSSTNFGTNNDTIIALDTPSPPASPENSADDVISSTTDEKQTNADNATQQASNGEKQQTRKDVIVNPSATAPAAASASAAAPTVSGTKK